MGSGSRFDAFRALAERRGRPGVRLLESLSEAAKAGRGPAEAWAPEVAERFGLPAASGLGPATFYADLAAPHGHRHVRICTAAACFAARAGRHLSEVEGVLGVRADQVDADGEVSLQSVRCLGYCYTGPACLDGDTPCTGPTLADQLSGRAEPQAPPIPALDATGAPVLLAGVVEGADAWQVWPGVVRTRTPERVLAEVSVSGLRGRGGAGFPVAAKWAAAGGSPDTVVVANGDEGDPGSYADRLLMEADPGRVLEGLALACFACGSRRGVVLVRSEYPRALARMRIAVERARADGHLGRRIHGTDVDLDVEVVAGSGSYVAGEETALVAGLEGGAAVPGRVRRTPRGEGCGMSRRWSTTSRRWPRSRGSSLTAGTPTPHAAHRRRPARSWSACRNGSLGLAATRSSWACRCSGSSPSWAAARVRVRS
ncbi:NAD(P)H-dependent oxidoreductase subunit E [Nonomuraea sp. NPDC049750]|uniref:NAD(P)H-dependent oxidoreductase subunit E n=1 Tax=Nonomuraea sp. NPDC049750 TaxID=3154738 RepID=UPI0033D60DAD